MINLNLYVFVFLPQNFLRVPLYFYVSLSKFEFLDAQLLSGFRLLKFGLSNVFGLHLFVCSLMAAILLFDFQLFVFAHNSRQVKI